MRVLGISSSPRKWGNTDLLVAEALRSAHAKGAEVSLLRLADLCLSHCTGCMRCLFKERDCVIPDRFPEVLEAMRRADAIVLGSPTYILAPNSILKIFQDRMLRPGQSWEFAGKVGAAIATAGVRGWEGATVSQLTGLLMFLGISVVDRFTGFAQGPGEILEDVEAMGRAARAGAALASGEKSYVGPPGMCPICNLDEVRIVRDGGYFCSICGVPGKVEERRFVPSPGFHTRFSKEGMAEHFGEKVLPSGPKFKERMREHVERVAAFKKTLPHL